MTADERAWLEALAEVEHEPLVELAYLAATRVALEPDELNAARRRTLFVLAAGGDPHRELTLDSRAVTALAADLNAPERRAELAAALAALRDQAADLPRVVAALAALLADGELAWRALAAALLAEELAED